MITSLYAEILDWYGIIAPDENYWLDWLNKKPCTTLFIDGNHENHNLLNQMQPISMERRIRPSNQTKSATLNERTSV